MLRNFVILFIIVFFIQICSGQSLPFFNGFEDGDIAGWDIVDIEPYSSGPSDWYIYAGYLRQNSNIYTTEDEYSVYTGTIAVAGDISWDDYTYNLDMRSSDDDGIGLVFRYSDFRNYYRVLLVEDAANGGPFKRLECCSGGSFTILDEIISYFTFQNQFTGYSIEVDGDSIKVYENGNLILEAEDSSHPSGKVGLCCYANDGASFDNIAVDSDFGINANFNTGPYLMNPTANAMTVIWETNIDIDGWIYWGSAVGVYTDSIYSPIGRNHEIVIAGLLEDTEYYYAIKAGSTYIGGEEYHFKTKVPDDAPYRMVIWGDNRTDYGAHETVVDAMITRNAELAINLGDVVTNGGTFTQWRDEFFYPARNIIKNTPFYVSIGNHEVDDGSFYDYMAQPGNEHWFSVRYGPVLLIFVDTNYPYIPYISEQWLWLRDLLESPEAIDAPWVFVLQHHPPYSEGWDSPGYDGEEDVRNYLVPLIFEPYDVDFVFAGHTHDYERGSKAGVNYVISGGGGSALDHWLQDWEWIDIYHAVYHYICLDIAEDYIIYRTYDRDNVVIDSTIFGTYLEVAEENQQNSILPEKCSILGTYPNPFNATAEIDYYLPEAAHIDISVHDLSGRLITKLSSGMVTAGRHKTYWDTNRYEKRGQALPGGVYMIRLEAENTIDCKKVIMMK